MLCSPFHFTFLSTLNIVLWKNVCVVLLFTLCSDVTMGFYAIDISFLLYRSLFIPVTIYNAEAWTNLTKTDLKALQTIQTKYLKRIFHAPSSTSNTLTFLETGTLPIKCEIHIRQLVFQHHIRGEGGVRGQIFKMNICCSPGYGGPGTFYGIKKFCSSAEI